MASHSSLNIARSTLWKALILTKGDRTALLSTEDRVLYFVPKEYHK